MNDHDDVSIDADGAPHAGEPSRGAAASARWAPPPAYVAETSRAAGPSGHWARPPDPVGVLKPTLGNVALALAVGSVLLARWDFGAPGLFAIIVAVVHLRETTHQQPGRRRAIAALCLGTLVS
ncbi:hypothetical protein ACQP00_20470 [Dactylosporangium sp. CS-047395]|uniref:hypothetical protein n=1 Tax=Dactylosporangium sp. CS-047395 TaxID=3239936 RepID=UPI003D8A605E